MLGRWVRDFVRGTVSFAWYLLNVDTPVSVSVSGDCSVVVWLISICRGVEEERSEGVRRIEVAKYTCWR